MKITYQKLDTDIYILCSVINKVIECEYSCKNCLLLISFKNGSYMDFQFQERITIEALLLGAEIEINNSQK